MENPLPTGTITFLFTDIESSAEQYTRQPALMQAALQRHHAILQAAIEAEGGYVFQIVGDAFCAAFHTAVQGLVAAVAAQRLLLAESWPSEIDGLRVRMGVHTGAAEFHPEQLSAGQYSGYETLSRVQRIMSAGHGGQILVSSATVGLLGVLPVGVSLRDMGAHHLRGLSQPERLFQVVATGLPAEFPPLRTPRSFPNNLPTQITSFIGREKELAEVLARLKTHRLVTLTGAGGCGKTRLALQVAGALLPETIDGAWLVELASMNDPDQLMQGACAALGLRAEGGKPGEESLVAFLKEKSLLLVLDNCEHLVDAVAQMAEALLLACPGITILASSREPLAVEGEAVCRIPPLGLAGRDTEQEVSQSEAGRLFVERAMLVLPGFRVTPDNAGAIAQVCRRLDGIPLAIELAAARIDILRVEQIAARLADVFSLLSSGRRTALPHHQTLRATIDWSYRLLGEAERVLLGRLAVFAGGWSLEAAEAVCAGPLDGQPDLPAGQILDLTARLADQSLVQVERNPGQDARYSMYETIRQYTLETQAGRGKSSTLRDHHLDYFLQLAIQGQAGLGGWEQPAWLRRLELEHPNLRVALEWALETRLLDALQMSVALAEFWDARGYYAEGCSWLDRALDATRNLPESPLRARGMLEFTSLAGRQVLLVERLLAKIDETILLARRVGDDWSLIQALHYKSIILAYQGAPQAEIQAMEEDALRLARRLGDARLIGQSLGPLAERARQAGDYPQAEAIFSESLATFEQVGHRREIAGALWNLAEVRLAAGDMEGARRQASASLAIYQELSDRHGVGTTLRTLGKAAARSGDLSQARRQLEESAVLFTELGDSECLQETRQAITEIAW
jgi:predicted ATPase/class 3 adenylate cyclase